MKRVHPRSPPEIIITVHADSVSDVKLHIQFDIYFILSFNFVETAWKTVRQIPKKNRQSFYII